MYKRIRILSISFFVIMGLLTLRIGYIQILGHEDLAAAAKMQQNIILDGADTRSVIYDRNGTPIAGGNQEYIYIIRAEEYDGETQNALDEVNAIEVPDKNGSYKVFVSQEYNKKAGERLIKNSEAYILQAARRYRSNQPAVHMIGYISSKDSKGASGLELMYDEELGAYNKKVTAPADLFGNLLQGYGLMVENAAEADSYIKNGVTTTLELGVQQEAERILADCDKSGAIVVLKVDTGEIIAAASTPVFDPYRIEDYMDSDSGEFINKVTQGTYPPGSVFKIIVAASALEAGISPDYTFNCAGHEVINGNIVKCETGGETGHGKISFRQAFAESCNCAFIQMGQVTGAGAIIEMADRFGMGKKVLEEFPGEQTGNIMSVKESQGAAIANLSIGQGETLVTPLQISAMTAVVANGGINPGIKITAGDNSDIKILDKEVASELQKMMEETVASGTGKDLGMHVKAGAKTGSAESTLNSNEVIHGWMTGYVPSSEPEYVITAFVEDGKSGRKSAGPIFSQMVNYLYENNLINCEMDF